MFLSEGIINNFIEGLSEEEIDLVNAIEDEEEAYKIIANLYKNTYGVFPSGTGIYLLKSKFGLGTEELNRKYIPSSLL